LHFLNDYSAGIYRSNLQPKLIGSMFRAHARPGAIDVAMKVFSDSIDFAFYNHILKCQVWARDLKVTTA
jgi:hypothetical protein